MRTLGNIIWHIPFLGFLFALAYALGGLFFCITIIGIPIGLGWLQFSLFLLSPFSKAMVSREDLDQLTGEYQTGGMQAFSTIVRILYFPFGLFAAISALCIIVGEFISIIGIPSGIVWAKSLSTIFNPVNKICVPRAVAMEIERRKDAGTLEKYSSQATDSTVQEHDSEYKRAESKSNDDLRDIIRRKDDYSPKLVNAAKRVLTAREIEEESIIVNEFIEKVQSKNDDDLKDIIRQKNDYNPKLVYAAEQVLLARMIGTEIMKEDISEKADEELQKVADENPISTFNYNKTFDFSKLNGESLIAIGALLPVVPCILYFIENIYTAVFKAILSANANLFLDIIAILLCAAGTALAFMGFIKVRTNSKGMNYIGIILIVIGSITRLGISILFFMIHDFIIYNDDSLFKIQYDTFKTIQELYMSSFWLYSLLMITGTILWKYLNQNLKMDCKGLVFICLATITNVLYHYFYSFIIDCMNYIAYYDEYGYSPQIFFLNSMQALLFIFMNIYGWYKFIGLDTQKQI